MSNHHVNRCSITRHNGCKADERSARRPPSLTRVTGLMTRAGPGPGLRAVCAGKWTCAMTVIWTDCDCVRIPSIGEAGRNITTAKLWCSHTKQPSLDASWISEITITHKVYNLYYTKVYLRFCFEATCDKNLSPKRRGVFVELIINNICSMFDNLALEDPALPTKSTSVEYFF